MSNMQSLINTVLSFTIDETTDFIKLVEFAGYNPDVIFQKVMASVKTADDRKHLQFIIFFGLLRGFGGGKTWAKLEERTGDAAGKKMLNTCRTKFSIVMQKDKLENVTIDRLMGAFPSLTFKAWQRIVNLGHGNSKQPAYNGNLPEEYRYPGSPAAMPSAVWAEHKENYLEWSVELQKLWNVPNPNRDDIKKFAELQFQNRLYPLASRG